MVLAPRYVIQKCDTGTYTVEWNTEFSYKSSSSIFHAVLKYSRQKYIHSIFGNFHVTRHLLPLTPD